MRPDFVGRLRLCGPTGSWVAPGPHRNYVRCLAIRAHEDYTARRGSATLEVNPLLRNSRRHRATRVTSEQARGTARDGQGREKVKSVSCGVPGPAGPNRSGPQPSPTTPTNPPAYPLPSSNNNNSPPRQHYQRHHYRHSIAVSAPFGSDSGPSLLSTYDFTLAPVLTRGRQGGALDDSSL